MTDPNPSEPRELSFEHEGHRFKVTASPGSGGYEVVLWRDDARVRGMGLVSWADIDDAAKSGFHADLVAGAMNTIRDAVLTENVRDPEQPKSDHGN